MGTQVTTLGVASESGTKGTVTFRSKAAMSPLLM